MNDDHEELREQEKHDHDIKQEEYFRQELKQSTKNDKKTLIKLGIFLLGFLVFLGIILVVFAKTEDFRSSLISKKDEEDQSVQSEAQSKEEFGSMMNAVLSKNATEEKESKDDEDSQADPLVDTDDKLEVPALSSSDKPSIEAHVTSSEPVKKREAPKPSKAYLNAIEPGLGVGANDKATEDNHLKAFRSELDQSTTLAKSTLIRCVLMQDVASTMESQTRCQVAKDVYSENGRRILIPAGSIASGASLGGFIKGQKKMFVVWDRLTTPGGVIVPLKGSQSVDKLGELGHKADVKSNFFVRFGNALLVSILSSAIETGFNDLNNHEHEEKVNINTSNIQSEFQMGLETLKNELDVQPNAHIKRGTMINIMVSEDIDFSEAL